MEYLAIAAGAIYKRHITNYKSGFGLPVWVRDSGAAAGDHGEGVP